MTPAEVDKDILILQMMRRREVMHMVRVNRPMRIPALVDAVADNWRDRKMAVRLLKRTVLQTVDEGALSVGDDYLVRLGSEPATEERVLHFIRGVWGHASLREQILHTTSRMRLDEFKPRDVANRLNRQKSRHATATIEQVMTAMMWLSRPDRAYTMTFIFRGERDHVLDMGQGLTVLAAGTYTDPSGVFYRDEEIAKRMCPMFRKNRREP